jgi:hypothetical protein
MIEIENAGAGGKNAGGILAVRSFRCVKKEAGHGGNA